MTCWARPQAPTCERAVWRREWTRRRFLRRHRAGLLECAQRHGLLVEDWYPEVVSGESLYARPQMLRLLEDVEAGRYDAVLCMDLDRLSRGRMKDQGIILDAFRDSGHQDRHPGEGVRPLRRDRR